jgi:hypothetical protein
MTTMFEEAPEGGDKVEFDKINGCTVLFFPKSTGAKATKFTKAGDDPKEYVRADVVILTNTKGVALKEPVLKNNAFLWGGFVVGSLRDMIGRTVLAKIEQGTDDSKGNPPWLLGKFDAAGAKIATEYLNKRHEDAKNAAASAEDSDNPFA